MGRKTPLGFSPRRGFLFLVIAQVTSRGFSRGERPKAAKGLAAISRSMTPRSNYTPREIAIYAWRGPQSTPISASGLWKARPPPSAGFLVPARVWLPYLVPTLRSNYTPP